MPALSPVMRRLLAPGVATAMLGVLVLSVAPVSDAATSIPGITPGCSWQAHPLPLPVGWTSGTPIRGDGNSTYTGYGIDAAGTSHALLWHAGGVQVLTFPDDGTAQASDVIRSGVVTVNETDAQGFSHGYLWKNGVVTQVASPEGTTAGVAAINDAGLVIGSAQVNGGVHALAWTVSDPTKYIDLGAGGNVNAHPLDVSDRGLIVGRNASAGYGQDSHAIGGTADPRVPVQVLSGFDPTFNSSARASEGTFIVGSGRLPDGSNGPNGGPLYANLAVSPTPKALLGKGTAVGVNPSGLIAGSSPDGATVWTSTQRWVLPNPLTGPGASSSAADVMDNGTVIGAATAPGQVLPLTWTCT